jgi:hypothetical protein
MPKPIVLQLGDNIRWNHDLHSKFQDVFEIRRSYSMSRPEFIRALKERQFGDFFAIYRPFWNTGGEMGNWDEELVSLLPDSCKVYASAGAGFDWVDTAALAKKGMYTAARSNEETRTREKEANIFQSIQELSTAMLLLHVQNPSPMPQSGSSSQHSANSLGHTLPHVHWMPMHLSTQTAIWQWFPTTQMDIHLESLDLARLGGARPRKPSLP